MNGQEMMQYIPLDKIVADKQVRVIFDETALNGLAASLKAVGQLDPIRVRKVGDRFVILDGERRFRASKRAGLATIAAIVEQKELCEGEILHKQIISECQRESLSPAERAEAFERLMKATGWTASETSSRLGLSPATVSKHLAILKLPESIRAQIADGSIAASAAPELAAINDPAKQAELAQQLADGRLTRDGLAGARRAARSGAATSASGQTNRFTAVLGPGRSVTVLTDRRDLESFIAVLEELLGKARRARTQGVAVATFVKMLRDQVHPASPQAT